MKSKINGNRSGWSHSKKLTVLCAAATVAITCGFAIDYRSTPRTLQIKYGANGIQKITYRGVVLDDVLEYPADAFHIGHVKITNLEGKVLSTGQYGWGENNEGKRWDAAANSWIYSFAWGSIRVRLQQRNDALDELVTETNNANSGIILDGASVFPFVLHFPEQPRGFSNASYPQLSDGTSGPGVVAAVYGSGPAATGAGVVAAVSPDASKPLYIGFIPSGRPNTYAALISSTTPDGVASFQPRMDRIVMPGHTDSFTVSFRFAAADMPLATLAKDAYGSWASTWPAQLNWPDRRTIGTVYLASSPSGNPNRPEGYANNPRRYFNDRDLNVSTTDGLQKFQRRVLEQAETVVQNLRRLRAQGAITWDIEGEQYPQQTSYVCSPDQIATLAPEIESVVHDKSSEYAGMKLDDAYFKIIRDGGFRVGVCVRPQQFNQRPDKTAQQEYLPSAQVANQLIRKMKYAHDRWGATLFYVDSTVESNGAVLDAGVLQKAAAALPDSLLIPEESAPKFYAYTAPFKNFLFHGDLGTEPSVYGFYPRAFSAILVNDVDPAKLAAAQEQLTGAVRRGDVLMVHADYWHANNATVQAIYAAGRQTH